MKMAKRIMAVILSVLMLLAIAPIGAYAQGETVIDKADITVRNDIAGMIYKDYAKFITINSDGLDYFLNSAFDFQCLYVFYHGERFNKQFVEGESYDFTIYFSAKPGYAIPDSVDSIELNFNGPVRGQEGQPDPDAYIDDEILSGERQYYVKFEMTAEKQNKGFLDGLIDSFNNLFKREDKVIGSADIAVRNDIAGLSVADYKNIIGINSKGLDYANTHFGALEACERFDNGDVGSKTTGAFENGHSYDLFIYLTAKPGYQLPNSADDIELKASGADDAAKVVARYGSAEDFGCDCYVVVLTVTAGEQLPQNPVTGIFESIAAFFANIFDFFGSIFA